MSAEMEQTKRTLCVGLVCLDIVKVVPYFPKEDSDMRCENCLWTKGGNAANTARVMSLLASSVEFLGSLACGPYLQFLRNGFEERGIYTDHCPVLDSDCPVSVVILNRSNGSRTILHTNRNLKELKYEDFVSVPLSLYSWIHFEGRPNIEALRKMLMALAGLADYVFVSKETARCTGFTDMDQAVEGLVSYCKPGGAVICAWGEKGAAAKRTDSDTVTSPAFPPPEVVDSLGAGDTFNAAVILALSLGKSLQEALTFGCRVAGAKCGMMGMEGLKGMQMLLE